MTPPRRHRALLAGALLLGLVLGGSARAQLAVEPEALSVAVAQGEEVTQTLTLRNAGSKAIAFCLSFERPLQPDGSGLRLSVDALGSACGDYGEVLALVGEEAIPFPSWSPYGLTMTPDGRLFTAEYSNFPLQTYELTPELAFVRAFPQPEVDELTNNAVTTGVAYNAETGTLWWLNIEDSIVNHQFRVDRALLLEGDLDGTPTGRRIELPVAETAPPPNENGRPVGLAYDPSRRWFYYTDIANETIWAVDSLGSVVDGYPVQPAAYPGASLAFGLDVLPSDTGGQAESVRLEPYVNPPGLSTLGRVTVTDRYGGDTAPGAEPLETPLPPRNPNAPPGVPSGEPVRSVLDPNGVLYYPWGTFDDDGIAAIRPHPLPPSWLVVEAWRGSLEPGEETEIDLRFRPGTRVVGTYEAILQAFEAETGAALEVPLSLEVTQGTTAAEDEAQAPEAPLLVVFPNPTAQAASVALVLATAGEVRVVVFDVLGREVAVLHEGALAAGSHTFTLAAARLPAGVYLVRAEAGAERFTARVTVLK